MFKTITRFSSRIIYRFSLTTLQYKTRYLLRLNEYANVSIRVQISIKYIYDRRNGFYEELGFDYALFF